ncbi:MAG: hypothetical protein V3V19_04160 [Cocleimonas sp.]
MKKSNISLSISTLVLLLAGFMFTSSTAFAEDAPAADTKEVAADSDKKADDKKKKKKGKDGEEPECE